MLDVVEQAAHNHSNRIAKTIEDMDEAGKSLPQIEKAVRSMVSSRSSWKSGLSTYATTATIEGVKTAVYTEGGNRVVRSWHIFDEHARPSHLKADGQERKGRTPYRVGGAALMCPGDPNGPIEETINCRCWQDWTIE